MRFPFAAVKDLRIKKKKEEVEGRSSIVKADSKSAATFKEIPEEILIEILVRLPAYSLMRFKCVSSFWSSLISSPYFTNLFYKFSSSKNLERRVFMYAVDATSDYMNSHMLFSSSFSNLDVTGSFPQLNLDMISHGFENGLEFVNALRGLMCFRVKREIQIINLTTRQTLSLPLIKSNMFLERNHTMWNYFGYDPVNDEYKVLSTISTIIGRRLRSETQVLVVGARASWRNTKSCTSSPPPHCPSHELSINIDGVLYYGAWSYEKRCVLMSFDLHCEEFNLFEFPIEAHIYLNRCLYLINLMNYQGQVALLDSSRLNNEGTLDLWVAEDVEKGKWSHKIFVLPSHQLRLTLGIYFLGIRGSSRSGEVMFYGLNLNKHKKSIHVIYDLERNIITRGVVVEPPDLYGHLQTTLWDDVASIVYLEA